MGEDLAPSSFSRPNFRMTFLKEKCPFNSQKFLMTYFNHRLYFVYFFLLNNKITFHRIFSFLFLTKNFYFTTKISPEDLYLISSYYASHSITVVLKIFRAPRHRCMGRSPTWDFGGPSPKFSLSLRPWVSVVLIPLVYNYYILYEVTAN